MKILAVGAHFDDVELGCGGALARYAAMGDEVHIFVATDSGFTNYAQKVIRRHEVAHEEGQRAARIMGAKSLTCGEFPTNQLTFNEDLVLKVRELIDRLEINMVFTHWHNDVHVDHSALGRATINAARHVPRLLLYRSNYYESGETFVANFYVDITSTIEIKRQAIMAHESEYQRIGEKWLDFFTKQHENDGQKIGVQFAETFMIVKYLV